MKCVVTVKNKTHQELEFGSYSIPALGVLHLPYTQYVEIAKTASLQPWMFNVDMRDVKFQSVSVKDFGAAGDGVADDTYPVQSAIDYVMGGGGGVVNVPAGIYSVSRLDVGGNVMLVGESKSESVIKRSAKADATDVPPLVNFYGGACGARSIKFLGWW